MSKCDVDLIGMYACIFQDAARAYPALEGEFSKDYSTLRRAVETRGLRLITVDLVACGKHFDRCLSQGKYESPQLPLTSGAGRTTLAPKFLRGLWLLVFDSHGRLKDCPDIQAIFFIRQIYLFGKKASYDCDRAALYREVERLLDHDVSLPMPSFGWQSEEGDINEEGFHSGPLKEVTALEFDQVGESLLGSAGDRRRSVRRLLGILDQVSGILTSVLGPYDPSSWRFRHGPGAVSEGPRTVNKYCWPSWDRDLEHEFPLADYGYHSYASWGRTATFNDADHLGENPVASRLVAVPKTVDTPRLIAAEPASKQWCQQNLLDYFCSRVKGSWISKFVRFDDQTQNQELCLSASQGGDLCTIDLKAASDSVSCWFVGNLFRRNPRLLRALRSVRTRLLRQDLHPGRSRYTSLRKYSMMGSAVTFPIESIGFLAIVLAGVCYTRGLRPTQKNLMSIEGVSVFGDDLIIPKDSWDAVVDLLEACCFKVNRGKSYSEGNFRESCGVDAFNGWSITPAYWRGPYTADPESKLSLVALRNHLYNRWLMSASRRIEANLRSSNIPYVGCRSGATGFHSREAVVISDPVRYCNAHHGWKALVTTFSGSGSRLAFGDESALLQYFTECPTPLAEWDLSRGIWVGPQAEWVNGVQSRVRMSMRRRWKSVYDLLGA